MARLNTSLVKAQSRRSSTASFATANDDSFASVDDVGRPAAKATISNTRCIKSVSSSAAQHSSREGTNIYEDATSPTASPTTNGGRDGAEQDVSHGVSALQAISGNARLNELHCKRPGVKDAQKVGAKIAILPTKDISDDEDDHQLTDTQHLGTSTLEVCDVADDHCTPCQSTEPILIVLNDEDDEQLAVYTEQPSTEHNISEDDFDYRDVAPTVTPARTGFVRSSSVSSILSSRSSPDSLCSASEDDCGCVTDTESVGESVSDDSDDSLADFIVSDSASDSELKRSYTPGRRRAELVAATPRKSRRKIVLDSDDSDCDSENDQESSAADLANAMSNLDLGSKSTSAPPSFDELRVNLAKSFLAGLDRKVTKGRMSRTAGTVPIVWSNSLKSTAGKAVMKPVRTSPATSGLMDLHSTPDLQQPRRYLTTIHLATSVIKTKDQLYNTLAHEFCHVAVFHVDGAYRHKHGHLFKKWARRCEDVFPSKKLNITTRHSYKLEEKYAWRCKDCAHIYKRPTRSINPELKRCGRCKGKLDEVNIASVA